MMKQYVFLMQLLIIQCQLYPAVCWKIDHFGPLNIVLLQFAITNIIKPRHGATVNDISPDNQTTNQPTVQSDPSSVIL